MNTIGSVQKNCFKYDHFVILNVDIEMSVYWSKVSYKGQIDNWSETRACVSGVVFKLFMQVGYFDLQVFPLGFQLVTISLDKIAFFF